MRLMERPLPFTPEGKEEFQLEIALLEDFRKEVQAEHNRAPEESRAALRRELEAVDEQLRMLCEATARGRVISNTGLIVAVGSEVELRTEYGRVTFTIAGPVAAKPKRGCISYDSPLGEALIGAELGDWVEFTWDGDRRKMRVVGIKRSSVRAHPTPVP